MDDHAALVLLLRHRLETLVDAMPAAQAGDVRSVHQARVATRRLRAAFPVLRKRLDEHAISKAKARVRRMTRALGPVRELDVSLQLLDEFSGRSVLSGRAIRCVRQSIVERRLEKRRAMLAAITPGKIERLRRELRQVGSGPEVAGRPAAVKDAVRRVERRAQTLARAIAEAGSLYVPERLHAVRIAAKKLRYAMEIERELKKSRATARIRHLKRLQDRLGRLRDLQVLADLTRSVQARAAEGNGEVAEELDHLVTSIEEDARKEHAAYMRQRESILKLCEAPALPESKPVAVA